MPRKDKSASKWTLRRFDTLNLKYNDTSDTLDYFSDTIIGHLDDTTAETVKTTLDQKKNGIVSYMNTYWDFTIDINERRTNRIERAIEELNNASDEDAEVLIRYIKILYEIEY